ncbi:MAG: lipoate--protein ligase family protein, partial [Anaerolineales bacterium]
MPPDTDAGLYPPATWRLLHSPAADGPLNMAIDEAILLAVAEGASPPTLRFFDWRPPCLSLGYSQPVADVDLARLAQLGYGLVRRATGGRAILHTDELTYSVIAPQDEPRVRGGVMESYQQLSAGLMRGLALLGLNVRADKQYDPAAADAAKGPVCFEVPSNYEITAGLGGQPRKLLGSAQVRKRGVVLQHGTLPLHGDISRIVDTLAFDTDAPADYTAASIVTNIPGHFSGAFLNSHLVLLDVGDFSGSQLVIFDLDAAKNSAKALPHAAIVKGPEYHKTNKDIVVDKPASAY